MAEPAARNERPNPDDFWLMYLNNWRRRQNISSWDIKKQIAFSHCSKECFELVKSLNQQPRISIQLDGLESVTVNIGHETERYIIKLVDEVNNNEGFPINFGLSARDAFVHLCEMYHQKELTIHLNPESKTLLEATRNLFDGFPINTIVYTDGSNRRDEEAYIKNALELLLPSKMLLIAGSPYDSYSEFRNKVLQFEYETLTLQHPKQINLLDLKSIHTEISIDTSPLEGRVALTTEHFQQFIRKWIKSEIYPKFKTILIHSDARGIENNYQQNILDGLRYQQLPNNWKYKNKPKFTLWRMPSYVNGVFEVQREADGQKAVISFETVGQAVLWKFCVDHTLPDVKLNSLSIQLIFRSIGQFFARL
ncbi:unnamed protein product [Caenorhabditis nigoni]